MKPFRAVTSQMIGRWIKQRLEECGIDTLVSSAHNTRHTSRSRAAEKVISLDLIKHAADWTGEPRTFANFY
jgi:hypothetical protein